MQREEFYSASRVKMAQTPAVETPAVETAAAHAPAVQTPAVETAAVRTVQPVRMAPAVMLSPWIHPIAPPSASLPLANTQSGSVFKDRNDPNVAWYLPSFVLVDDIDTTFAFVATQSSTPVDTDGSPSFHATISLSLHKVMPDDATAFGAAHSSMQLREIPLNALAVTLTTMASDAQTGEPSPSTYSGQIAGSDAAYTVSFNALVGAGVIIAYENLRNGGATLSLTASYDVWREPSARPPWTFVPISRIASAAQPARFAEPMIARPPQPPPATPSYVQGTAVFSATLALAEKYANVGYATAYTVSDGTTTHAILSVNDLKNFQTDQSEFSEFTALGVVSAKYPSFSRLYIGALSRTIVAVPAQYGIQRSSAGTAAVCQALLNSSATESSACTFEFSFVLAPVVSAIDLVELSRDVGASSGAHDCTVVLPLQLDAKRPMSLSTPFQSSVSYLPGAQPHTFSLAVEITDAGANAPAVANANLFIRQLTAALEPFLVGSFGIKLDDGYPQPIDVPAVLHFSVTSSSDDLGFTVDTTSQAVDLLNNSPLDLELSRYATVGDSVNIVSLSQTLSAKQSLPLPGVTAAATPAVLVDRSIALEPPVWTPATTARYLAFNVQDVQSVEYELGVVSAGVSFSSRGIASIKVQIVLDDLPQISIPVFTLTPLDQSGNQTISLPTQYRLTALNATVSFTVAPLGAGQSPVQFTLTNDFVATPVLMLNDASIPNFSTS